MTQAIDNLGAHLLGRKPSPRDDRDFQLSDFIDSTITPLDRALSKVLSSTFTMNSVKTWAKIATQAIDGLVTPPGPVPIKPTPVPPSPPSPTPSGDVIWADADSVLDQGQTPHCVGFGWAGWGDTLPVDDHFSNADGDALYYECKVIDGEPKAEDGSDVRSGAKAMLARGRLSAYAFAKSVDEALAWLLGNGPVVMGTDWTQDMFTPDGSGFIKPTGAVAGGHCYIAVGHIAADDAILFQNSWGSGWGLSGRFKMTVQDFASLFANGGEACAAVELPIAAVASVPELKAVA